MNDLSPTQTTGLLLGALALWTPASASAQQEAREDIVVSGQQAESFIQFAGKPQVVGSF